MMKVYIIKAGNYAQWTAHKAGAAHYAVGWHEFPDWYAESLVASGHARLSAPDTPPAPPVGAPRKRRGRQ